MGNLYFNEKIECIYKYIANSNINELTKLFYVRGAKASFENRKSYIRKKWLKKSSKALTPKTFKRDYFKYDFAHLEQDGKRLFYDGEEFLSLALDEFCKRVKDYQAQYVNLDEQFVFRYLYFYNEGEISSFVLKYIKNLAHNKSAIEASFKDVIYKGVIEFFSDKIVLSLQNSIYYMHAIFSRELIEASYSIGVATCMNKSTKTPTAKKVVLSKNSLLEAEFLPLIINKKETLQAKENRYLLNNSLEKKLYKNSIIAIKDISQFLDTVLEEKSFYRLLAIKELEAISFLLEKTLHNNTYYVYYKKRIIEQVLKSYNYKSFERLCMVYPLLEKEYIFSQLSKGNIELQQQLFELAKRVEIEIVFVIESCKQQFTNQFMNFLKRASKLMRIYFVLCKDIENQVESIDILFTSNKDFVVAKFLRNHFEEYDILIDAHHIKKFESSFLNIKYKSIVYNESMDICKEFEQAL